MKIIEATEVDDDSGRYVTANVYDPESRLTYGVRVPARRATRAALIRAAKQLRDGAVPPRDDRGLVRHRDDLVDA